MCLVCYLCALLVDHLASQLTRLRTSSAHIIIINIVIITITMFLLLIIMIFIVIIHGLRPEDLSELRVQEEADGGANGPADLPGVSGCRAARSPTSHVC